MIEKYGFYVWSCYGITLFALGIVILNTIVERRRALIKLSIQYNRE